METWEQVTAKKPFITDLGEENEKKEQTVCRFEDGCLRMIPKSTGLQRSQIIWNV